MKYHLISIVGCIPKLLSFKTKKERKAYTDAFIKKYGSLDDGEDNWIDLIFEGKVDYYSPTTKKVQDETV
jgi:hypothetical protein